MSRRNTDFQTIRSEGGLLPPDLLRRILDPKEKIPGTQPEAYGLPKGERINDTITQSWNRLRRHWAEFREAAALATGAQSSSSSSIPHSEFPIPNSPTSLLPTSLSPSSALTALTNDKWSLPLFRELGFGMLPTSPGPEIDGRTYAINRFFGTAAIHLVGCGLSLDRRAAGVRGAAVANPHGLVQEFLNRSQGHLWGIVSNGLRFRILRDNQALSRQSYLEFDLESLFNGEVFSDFVLLWLTAHASRFMAAEEGKQESCLLEQWTKLANEQGARALESLRGGVEKALQVLGQGFVGHPRNTALREALRSGELSLKDFHGQLLRVVYRLIFLFVAEDRTLDGIPLIHTRDGEIGNSEIGIREIASRGKNGAAAATSPIPTSLTPYSLYAQYYSTARLRDLAARIRGSRHGDLWQQFNLLVGALSGDDRFNVLREQLALPALGSFLWSPESTWAVNAGCLANSEIANSEIASRGKSGAAATTSLLPTSLSPSSSPTSLSNADFLEALRHLAFTRQDRMLRQVDYRNLGAEELGGVYESLLALTPLISGDGSRFNFAEFSGNERKTSGSYYTPDCLVQCLLDSALDPVVEERLEEAKKLARELGSREIGNREENKRETNDDNKFIPGLDGVAEGDGSGRKMLSPDEDLPEGRVVRHDLSNPKSGSIHSGEHSRGMGERGDSGIHSVSTHSAGESQGSGDTSDPVKAGRTGQNRADRTALESIRGSGEDAQRPQWFLEAQKEWLKLQSSSSPNSLPPYSLSPFSFLAEKALLSLKICDPAVGSGHFLVGAAHRLARHLSRVRALALGDSEPSPILYQQSLRDVIGHCLYGVDINPMAAELCKVSLWLEALEPGKPLSFLDHHIQCGNSLIGTKPELIEQGIPDEAFTPIEGDDRAYCTKYKKRNKEERTQMDLDEYAAWEHLGNLPAAMAKLDALKDDMISGIQEKQRRYEAFIRSADYVHAHFLADAWCAAFVWPKRDDKALPYPITNKVLRQIERNPKSVHDFTPWLRDEVLRLANQYQFFHWHLAFPEVFPPQSPLSSNPQSEIRNPKSQGGFDVLLGNPPWERVKLQEKEWFAERSPEIANAPNAAARKRMITDLVKKDPGLYQAFQDDLRKAEGESHFMRNSGKYPLCGRGDINVYTVFAELNRELTSTGGRVGCIVPSGIATDDTTKFFFQDLMDTASLASLYSFENEEFIFPAVHHATRFCLLTLRAPSSPISLSPYSRPPSDFVFFARQVFHLNEPDRHFTLSAEDIALLNPNTRTCPIFRSKADATLTKAIYRQVPVLIKESRDGQPEENPWGITFNRMFDMSNDSHLFRTREQLEAQGYRLEGNHFVAPVPGESRYLPLYEAKMIHHFDHRWGTYEGQTEAQANQGKLPEMDEAKHTDPNYFSIPNYWVSSDDVDERLRNNRYRSWLLGFRDITGATVLRTVIASIFPRAAVGNKIPLILVGENDLVSFISLSSNLCAFVLDFSARQKVGGTTLNFFLFKQFAVLSLESFNKHCLWADILASINSWLLPRILELTYTAWDLEHFAQDCGWNGPPFRWEEERRFLLRCELDAAFFHLYLGAEANGEWRMAKKEDGCPYDETPEQLAELKKHFPTPRHAVDYIMETFPIVKRKDEAAHGHYRTKDTILDIYDAMQRAIATGKPYQTRLDPPPADPRCCHPPRENNQ